MNSEVCAAIVTYHPGAELKLLIETLRPQVGSLIVVDNRSPEALAEELRRLAEKYDFSLLENPENYGIGTALNQSIAWAREHPECEFILFF